MFKLMTRSLSLSRQHYHDWSREQLLERVLELEHQKPKTVKKGRDFDMNKFSQRYVAFKFAYLGWPYCGYAGPSDGTVPAVEEIILAAFKRLRLIDEFDDDDCEYAKCGRTDRGVSAMGQVISLRVRSQKPLQGTEPWEEFAYLEKLNRILPKSIRFYAWAPVDQSFSARFSCQARHYRYYFLPRSLNLVSMQKAAKFLVGEHDFRNFCKTDASKQLRNYVRTIHRAEIVIEEDGVSYLDLVGSAFLWHQVRCMMAILFLVGQGLEQPNVVESLLAVDTNPRRPGYEMASEFPLVLYDCLFRDIEWRSQDSQHPYPLLTFNNSLYSSWYEYKVKERVSRLFLDMETEIQGSHLGKVGTMDGSGHLKYTSKYRNILTRPLCEDVFVAADKWAETHTHKWKTKTNG